MSNAKRPSKGRRPRPAPQSPEPGKGSIIAVISQVISLISVGFAGVAYFDQRSANEAQLQVDRAAANAAVRHYASQVTYWLEGVPHSTTPDLVISNRSSGPIRGLMLKFPQPVQGCSKHCQWKAYDWYTLPDIPPCSMATTTTFTAFKAPAVGSASLNGSILDFTDQNGNDWALLGGYGKLVRMTRYKQPVGFSWSGAVKFKPAEASS
jgi:hypothetical protein